MRRLLGFQPTGRPRHDSRDQAIRQHVLYLCDQGSSRTQSYKDTGKVYGVAASTVRRIVAGLELDDAVALGRIGAMME